MDRDLSRWSVEFGNPRGDYVSVRVNLKDRKNLASSEYTYHNAALMALALLKDGGNWTVTRVTCEPF